MAEHSLALAVVLPSAARLWLGLGGALEARNFRGRGLSNVAFGMRPHATRKCVGLDAPWRRERRSHWELLEMWRRQGAQPSPLMAAPGFSSDVFQLDWLHVVDIGVACDLIGALLAAPPLPAADHEAAHSRLHVVGLQPLE